ncbi:MAG: HAD hydrolase-like protein [Rhodobacteraceae bacterium]|nr:HAD hydrolase-like protein [Paracoccaceae bacterium]
MRTLVFDLDGTLADTSADLIAAANACFEGRGLAVRLDPSHDALTAFMGGRAMLRLGFTRALRDWDESMVDADYPVLLAAYADGIDRHTRLYPGAAEAVEGLRAAGWATAICTNKPAGLAETLVTRLGVRGLFGALVGADTLPVRKPDPAPYRLAVDRAGGRVTASALVGDTDTDVATARAAGGVARLAPDAMLDAYAALADVAARLVPRA